MPASTLERSKMSLMSDNRCWPLVKMSPVYSRWLSVMSPTRPSLRASENPMMALSGVRSSWLMVARNSDFILRGVLEFEVGLQEGLFEALALGDVTGGGEDPLEVVVAVMEGGRVVRDEGLLAVLGPHRQLVVVDPVLGQHPLDGRLRPGRDR